MQKIANLKGFTYAAISSSTFGLAPFFSIRLLNEGFSPFEVLSYRWGTASLALLAFGLLTAVGAAGIVLIVAGVTIVVVRGNRNGGR